MAKKFYRGINNKATEMKKFYIGVGNKAKRVVKMYIGIDNVAKICYELAKVTISYVTNLTSSFTSKTIYIGHKYPIPTITPSNSNREDFWFKSDATAKNDSKKKYIDYPWCAYADANPNVYKLYGYSQDMLAKHWNETGRAVGYSKGDVASQTCLTEEDHTLQHVYRSKVVKITATASESSSSKSFANIHNSKNNILYNFISTGSNYSSTQNAYPGMYLILQARHVDGLSNVGSDGSACAVKIDGKKVSGRGEYTYKIPDDIKSIKVVLSIDNHWDGGQSWVVSVTTTKL